jgi:hypothetical protein
VAIAVPVRAVDLLPPAPAATEPTLVRDVPPGTVACWQGFWGVVGSRWSGGHILDGAYPFARWDGPALALEPTDELDEVIVVSAHLRPVEKRYRRKYRRRR